jgi:hypothetical protein
VISFILVSNDRIYIKIFLNIHRCSDKDKPTLVPLDEIDQCCQSHQTCNVVDKIGATPYPYKSSFEDGTIECLNNQETKAHRQCKCDLELARCLQKHQDVYTNNLLYISDEKCSPGSKLFKTEIIIEVFYFL